LFCENVAGLKRRAQEEAILPNSRKLTQIRAREKKKNQKKEAVRVRDTGFRVREE
jgi:hypothetical protein